MLEPLLINKADLQKMLDAARNEGILEGKLEIAKKMLLIGFSLSQVASLTRLPFDEFSKLPAEEEPKTHKLTLKEEAERFSRRRAFLDYFI